MTDSAAPQVIVRLPSPTNSRTLPKSTQTLTTLALLPQPQETIQELKLAINDWIGGYWLGPYSLRIPAGASAPGHLLSRGKDGVEVRAGEKLSDWMEVGDVFSWAEEGDERVLEVVRGRCTAWIRLRRLEQLLTCRTLQRF